MTDYLAIASIMHIATYIIMVHKIKHQNLSPIERFHRVNLFTQFLVNSCFHRHFGEQPYGAFLS